MSLDDLKKVLAMPAGPKHPDDPIALRELGEDIRELYRTGLQPGFATPWHGLTSHYTMKPGQVTVVTGAPHSGKSPFVNALALHGVVAHGWTVAWSSPEHLPYHDLSARLFEQFYRMSFTNGTVLKMTERQVDAAIDVLGKRLYFMPVSEQEATIEYVLTRAKKLVDHGLKGLVIDPYGEFEHRRPKGMTETEYVSQILTMIRLFAREYQVHVWIVAHPTKLQKQEDGTYPVVKPYDIAASAAWHNKPDCILSVYRDPAEASLTQIHIQKVKFREVGHVGVVTLRHDAFTGAFYDMPVQPEERP